MAEREWRPYCRIVELVYPSRARPGERVHLFCRYHNEGGPGPTFCGFWDDLTGRFLGGGGYEIHLYCMDGGFGIKPVMPEREWRIRVEVGGDTSSPTSPIRRVTDTRTFTIKLAPKVVVLKTPLLTLTPMAVGLLVAVAAAGSS